MYFIPQPAECPKCKFKMDVSPDSELPVCPKCWEKFLKAYGIPRLKFTGEKRAFEFGKDVTSTYVND